MDSSDGLAICLHTIAEASEVGMRIDRLPYRRQLEGFASENRYRVDELVLYGGEEYEIVGTVPKTKIGEAEAEAKATGSRIMVIGETTGGRRVVMADGSAIEKRGWIQLS